MDKIESELGSGFEPHQSALVVSSCSAAMQTSLSYVTESLKSGRIPYAVFFQDYHPFFSNYL